MTDLLTTWRGLSPRIGDDGGRGDERDAVAMKRPINDLDEVERWTGEHLDASAAAALRICPGWTYRPIRWGLRRPTAVTVPHPDRLTTPDEAARWAAVAKDLAVESRELTAVSVIAVGLAFSINVACLGFGLSRLGGPAFTYLEGFTILGLVVLAVGFVAAVVRPIHEAPVWERRATALQARAEELAATSLAAREAATRRSTLWPWHRADPCQGRQG